MRNIIIGLLGIIVLGIIAALISLGITVVMSSFNYNRNNSNSSFSMENTTSTPQNVNVNENERSFTLSSSAFEEGALIPVKYSCDGEGINPPLHITNVPEEAETLVLLVEDPDIPESVRQSQGIDIFDHWILFNIPTETTMIEEGEAPGIQGVNSTGENGYTGMCPPDTEHRYFFRVYALDRALDLERGATKAEVKNAFEGHVVQRAELMGRYERQE